MRRLAYPLLVLITVVGFAFYRPGPTYRSLSPDGAASIVIDELENGFSVSLQRKHQPPEPLLVNTDCSMAFAHTIWDGDVAAVFVSHGCGKDGIAYDTRTRRETAYSPYEARLADSIIRSYGVTAEELYIFDGDVFEWASDFYPGRDRGRREFRKRHPPFGIH